MKISISDNEFKIYRTNRFFRYFMKSKYPNDINSGKPVREFIFLADRCSEMGLTVIPHKELKNCLKNREKVLKFGKTDIYSDINLLSLYNNNDSEWNLNNLEKILYWDQYVSPTRKLWNFSLDIEEHKEKLREIFSSHSPLFIKTSTKGWAGIYNNFEHFFGELGDISSLCEESKNIIVSELMNIKMIEAQIFGETKTVTDEWRHYVYKGNLISSTHVFECNDKYTDNSGYDSNVEKTEDLVRYLIKTDFATTYVLDTCTLSNGKTDIVEVNNFFQVEYTLS